MLVRNDLVAVLLQGGNFGTDDTHRVAFVLAGYATSIWAYCSVQVLTRGFYARNDLVTPVRLAMLTVVANLALNLVLIWTPLREAGLAWSTAACGMGQALILWVLLYRSAGDVLSGVLTGACRSVFAALVMAAAVIGVNMVLADGTSWGASLCRLGVGLGVGIGVYAAVTSWMHMPELYWTIGRSLERD